MAFNEQRHEQIEKTHFGTILEINAQREFGFEGGDETDYRIAGHQVDAKWSQTSGSWMPPMHHAVDEVRLRDARHLEDGRRDADDMAEPERIQIPV
uniref:NaeI family type II restriction endonuclease n=1 Tax=Rhodococcus oryzae TaxID=2571143 RepID=UPI001FE9E91D|nr:NaeI family type II restriction endonuclease [Rhodococcus oryzae]